MPLNESQTVSGNGLLRILNYQYGNNIYYSFVKRYLFSRLPSCILKSGGKSGNIVCQVPLNNRMMFRGEK